MSSHNNRLEVPKLLSDENRRTFLIFFVLVAFLIPDVIINYVAELIEPLLVTMPSIIFFTIVVSVYCIGGYILMEFIKKKSRDTRLKDFYLNWTHRGISIIQYALIIIVVVSLIQILFTSRYTTALLIAAALISEITAVGLLGLFAQRFFSWLKLNKHSIVILLYGLSFAFNAISLGVIAAYDISYLPQKEAERTPESEVVFPSTLEPGSVLDVLLTVYTYIIDISFGLLIVATAILLHHYSKRIGRIKFWIIILLPLLYNISTSIENLGIYTPVTDSDWFNWYLFVSLNSTAGGILFGIAFWTVGKTVRQDSNVRQYLNFAIFGFVLLFISNQPSPSAAPYPPYGIVTMTLLPLASYMIFLGVYSTAVSISQDNQLRKSIKKYATKNSNLLSSIGTAQMEQEIQKSVNSMKDIVYEQEKALEEQTGIEANLEEDEMKKYLEEVMQEVGKAKKPST